jgi:hypothetical protein
LVRQLSLNPDPEHNPCPTQPISQKVVKRGFRPAAQPQKCVVSFERYPVWLWALRPCDWSHILITETDARRLRQFHMSTWIKFEPKIVAVSSLPSPGNDASVWWISGSHDFGESHRELASTPTVLWMSDSRRRTPPSTSKESWVRLSHANVGSTTRA